MGLDKLSNDIRIAREMIPNPRESVYTRSRGVPPWSDADCFRAVRYVLKQFSIALTFAVLVLIPASFLPEEPARYERKIAYLKDNPERYDIIFIGSSRILHGLPVRHFDAELRSRGAELKPSFNVGELEALMHQNFYTIRQLVEGGVRPHYLVVEAGMFTSALTGPRLKRFEVWHDREETLRVLKTTLAEDDLPAHQGNRLERAWMHIVYFLRRNLPVGRMLEISFDPLQIESERDRIKRTLLEQTGGYLPLPHDASKHLAEVRRYLARPKLWEDRMEKLAADYDGDYPRPVNLKAFLDMIEYVQSRNIRLVFVGTPYSTIEWVEPLLWMEQNGLVSTREDDRSSRPLFLNFNRPSLPYVKDFDYRADAAHTNNRGARLWAEDLAQAFVDNFDI